jgi:hypothetical protein
MGRLLDFVGDTVHDRELSAGRTQIECCHGDSEQKRAFLIGLVLLYCAKDVEQSNIPIGYFSWVPFVLPLRNKICCCASAI